MIKNLYIGCFALCLSGFIAAQPTNSLYHTDFEKDAILSGDPFKILLAADPQTDSQKYTAYLADFSEITERLNRKREKLSDFDFLHELFFSVHKKELDWYTQNTKLTDVLNKGQYDCLTGTALYSLLLTHFKIPFEIYEFDYHVFLMAHIGQDSVLLEATDPFNGFISNTASIAAHIDSFQQSEKTSENTRKVIAGPGRAFSNHVFRKIGINQLAGLQYYNMALLAYNNGYLYESRILITKASLLYPSERIQETLQYFFSTMPVSYVKG